MGFAQRIFSDVRQPHKDLRQLQRRYRSSSTVTYSLSPLTMGNGVQIMLSHFWQVSSMETHQRDSWLLISKCTTFPIFLSNYCHPSMSNFLKMKAEGKMRALSIRQRRLPIMCWPNSTRFIRCNSITKCLTLVVALVCSWY